MKVQMLPHITHFKSEESGIRRVVEAYFRFLPQFGVELVHPDADTFDILAVHAGMVPGSCTVAHVHGLYWSADYPSSAWQFQVNSRVIDSIRHAKEVTVPSSWVAETFERDMRFSPHVIPHGIEWDEWQHDEPVGNYVLWNKNRNVDVCSPVPVMELARRFPQVHFKTTFIPPHTTATGNVEVTGLMKHPVMKKAIQSSLVYLSSAKETMGIGILEAMAAGIPVLGFDYGGNSVLIEHGVSGYLAEVGNYDDLAEGLVYCVENRQTLGENARHLAKQWTWENACELVAGVYAKAMQDEEDPLIHVTIPCHDKAETIVRSIESIKAQTLTNLSCVIVNDSSTDDSEQRIRDAIADDKRFLYEKVDYRNVAKVRNHGAKMTSAPFLCFLDGDDWIDERFLETCIKPLLEDRSLGISFTGLTWYKPDGTIGVSEWPSGFDYDKQLRRQNQCPTCSVIRRKFWDRVGGQNPKYSMGGAGSEDAECYLRMGSIGAGAIQATQKPLFHYSWQSGIVSGDPHYQEIDWTELMPWAGKDGDGLHPFASVATPRKWSHPVRQFDEPSVSVIIPVGPGHEESVKNALDSLEHQTMRKWEAIVVWDAGGQYGEAVDDTTVELHMPKASKELLRAYPYVKMWYTGKGEYGAGYARNRGVEIARAPFIVFVDSDDFLYPRCLERMLEEWNNQSAIIYTDYVGKAFVDDPAKLDPALQKNLYHYDERTKEAVIGHKAADYSCEKAQKQPVGERPFLWCNVTALIPKAWHYEIGGFDEEMPSWEDVDYHWRMAKHGKCYTRIPEELMVYQFHTGHRREKGRQGFENLLSYLREKHRKEKIMPCKGCGGSRRPSSRSTHQPAQQAQAQVAAMSDDSFTMCVYTHTNVGTHQVYGAVGHQQRIPGMPMTRLRDAKYHFNYGYRAGGGKESFLVHKDDARVEPNKFLPADSSPVTTAPKVEQEPLSPPEPIAATQEMPVDDEPVPVTGPSVEPTVKKFDLQVLPGVGGTLAQQLNDAGVASKDDVVNLGIEGLQKFSGVGPVKAQQIIEAIMEMP